eukprot:670268-Heterocapsa_arctica.AAC.1
MHVRRAAPGSRAAWVPVQSLQTDATPGRRRAAVRLSWSQPEKTAPWNSGSRRSSFVDVHQIKDRAEDAAHIAFRAEVGTSV